MKNNVCDYLLRVDNGEKIESVLNDIGREIGIQIIEKDNKGRYNLERLYDVLWYFSSTEFINPKALKNFDKTLELIEMGGDIHTLRKLIKGKKYDR